MVTFIKIKLLEFNQYMKWDKMSYNTYADMEPLIKKIDGCANNPKKLFNNKNRWTYSLWVFNVNNLDIWSFRKQT